MAVLVVGGLTVVVDPGYLDWEDDPLVIDGLSRVKLQCYYLTCHGDYGVVADVPARGGAAVVARRQGGGV